MKTLKDKQAMKGSEIDLWYDDRQVFGRGGLPQKWINILGRVRADAGVNSFSYVLNEGPRRLPVSIGPDGFRLCGAGDFNIELDHLRLREGENRLTLFLVDNGGREIRRNVLLEYRIERPAGVITSDWSSASHISDYATVVDGLWSLSGAGARVEEAHYDRVLAVGDMDMTSFAISADVTIEAVHTDPVRMGFPSNGWAVGFGLKWQGHRDWDDIKPRRGFYPFGALAWFKPSPNGDGHHLCLQSGSPKNPLQELCDIPCELQLGVPYRFSCRAELCAERTSVYRFSVGNTTVSLSERTAAGSSDTGGKPAAAPTGAGGKPAQETPTHGEKAESGFPAADGAFVLAEISAPGTEGELRSGSVLFIAHNVTAVLGDYRLQQL